MTRTFSVVDLFAGVGGFSQGFLRVNREDKDFQFELKLLVDSDPTASFTFKKNFPRIPFWNADIGKITSEQLMKLVKTEADALDFLIGGPPCQGFRQTANVGWMIIATSFSHGSSSSRTAYDRSASFSKMFRRRSRLLRNSLMTRWKKPSLDTPSESPY